MNARLNKNDARFCKKDARCSVYNDVTNENGKKSIGLLAGLQIASILDTGNVKEYYGHTLPSGKKSQVDYILINTKWKNSALNCEAYNTFSTVGSDHRIVTAKLRLSLRQSKSSTIKKSDTIGVNFLL